MILRQSTFGGRTRFLRQRMCICVWRCVCLHVCVPLCLCACVYVLWSRVGLLVCLHRCTCVCLRVFVLGCIVVLCQLRACFLRTPISPPSPPRQHPMSPFCSYHELGEYVEVLQQYYEAWSSTQSEVDPVLTVLVLSDEPDVLSELRFMYVQTPWCCWCCWCCFCSRSCQPLTIALSSLFSSLLSSLLVFVCAFQ
jgi:hypothetical protein